MEISEKILKLNKQLPAIWEAIKELVAWIFVTFLLPLVQLFIIIFSKDPTVVYENVYNIVFATIASFLTGVFFVSNFWKQNRTLVRMMLIISYLISFGLFLFSLVYVMFGTEIFIIDIYKWGAIVAFTLALFVGFFSKFDEKTVVPRQIAEEGKRLSQGSINGNEFKL